MTPIDQIRKALEAVAPSGEWERGGKCSVQVNDSEDWGHARIDVAANKLIAGKLAGYVRACNPVAIAALLASHDAAVQRAAEMEADALDVEIPEGWAFYSADFSINADDFSKPGWVMLRRTGRNYTAWHALDDEAREVTALFTQGQGFDYAAALKQAIRAIPMDSIRAIKE